MIPTEEFLIYQLIYKSNIERMVKTIKIDDNTHAELSKLGSIGQTFNDVIWMLIKNIKIKKK